ncbi:hypothetical protein ACU8V4_02060 [Pseudoalteromonas mariniglutinosa]
MNITPPLVMIKCAVFVLSGLLLFGCSSTKQTVQTNNEQYVQITKSELQQLQTSSAQWQAIKPDIERLLLIESDLNLLITQLTAIANEEPAQSNTAMTAQAQPPIQAPVAQPQRTPPRYLHYKLSQSLSKRNWQQVGKPCNIKPQVY